MNLCLNLMMCQQSEWLAEKKLEESFLLNPDDTRTSNLNVYQLITQSTTDSIEFI